MIKDANHEEKETTSVVTRGGTPGYEIGKGFKTKLPSHLNAQDRRKLKDAAEGVGFTVEE